MGGEHKDDISECAGVCVCMYTLYEVLYYTQLCLVTLSVALYWIIEKFHEMYPQIIEIFKF